VQSTLNTGPTPGRDGDARERIAAYRQNLERARQIKQNAASLHESWAGVMHYQSRVRSLAMSDYYAWLDTLFPGKARELAEKDPEFKDPRWEALKLRDKILGAIPVTSRVRICAGIYRYHTDDYKEWFFVQTFRGVVYKSVTYGSEASAMSAFNSTRIRWIINYPLPSVPP